ncbi:uncharacterized protein V6R79_019384 [Siganus canaliculatus]
MLLLAEDRNHVAIHGGSILLAGLAQMLSAVFFTLAKENCVPNALFHTPSKDVPETFSLEVTMDWWSQNYWILIDAWSWAWLLKEICSLCRRNVLGPECCNPEIHPPVFYLAWATANFARISHMLLWDRHDILEGVIVMWIPPVLSIYMLYMSYSNMEKHRAWLSINNPNAVSMTRYLNQNGLAAFTSWSLLNALVGLGMVFKYKADVPDPLISTITLTLVSVCTTAWFVLQSFLLKKYLRHTFSVYAVLVLGLSAMFTRSYRFHGLTVNTIYCGILMLVMTIINTAHLICTCLRTDKSIKPLIMEPSGAFEGCQTVCKPEGNMKHKYDR